MHKTIINEISKLENLVNNKTLEIDEQGLQDRLAKTMTGFMSRQLRQDNDEMADLMDEIEDTDDYAQYYAQLAQILIDEGVPPGLVDPIVSKGPRAVKAGLSHFGRLQRVIDTYEELK
ncbi:unnamed protein product [marine sediment metagenome]|uniref:Uncharacterized protein n=1 Tax=marine sediment metagenome TaxID=412755 RepID=X1VHI1_9ZZZZ